MSAVLRPGLDVEQWLDDLDGWRPRAPTVTGRRRRRAVRWQAVHGRPIHVPDGGTRVSTMSSTTVAASRSRCRCCSSRSPAGAGRARRHRDAGSLPGRRSERSRVVRRPVPRWSHDSTTGCEALLRDTRDQVPWRASHLDPAPNRAIIARMLNNLRAGFDQRGDRVRLALVMRMRMADARAARRGRRRGACPRRAQLTAPDRAPRRLRGSAAPGFDAGG